MNDLSSFQTLYKETAKQNARALKSGLESGDVELAHRSAHTLKSKSYLMGQKDIGDLAKTIEDTLYDVINKKNPLSQDIVAKLTNQARQIENKI